MQDNTQYTRIAASLHWLMAIAFILMIGSGLAFDRIEMPQSLKFNMYQWHKSLGIILLCLFFIRIAWRFFHKPPALPSGLKKLDLIAAKFGHIGLYALMFLIPFSGWLMVSSSPYGLPTIIFGLFEWPHFPIIGDKTVMNTISKNAHEYMGYGFIVLIGAHIAGTFKHLILEKINLLPRMWPFIIALCVLPFAVQAKPYDVDYAQSTITFTGSHAGNPFKGTFEKWDAAINFDDKDLNNSTVSVTFDMKHAKTGNAMYDGTLPKDGWFHTSKYPTGSFTSTFFEKKDSGYKVTGDLSLRDITKPVSFDFTLEGNTSTTMKAQFPIQRMDFGVGAQADPNSEWVNNEIMININLVAN